MVVELFELIAVFYTLITAITALRLGWRGEGRPRPPFTPPVSVLKPLHGEEAELLGNPASFARQD